MKSRMRTVWLLSTNRETIDSSNKLTRSNANVFSILDSMENMFRNIRERREAFKGAEAELRRKIERAAQQFEPTRMIIHQVS